MSRARDNTSRLDEGVNWGGHTHHLSTDSDAQEDPLAAVPAARWYPGLARSHLDAQGLPRTVATTSAALPASGGVSCCPVSRNLQTLRRRHSHKMAAGRAQRRTAEQCTATSKVSRARTTVLIASLSMTGAVSDQSARRPSACAKLAGCARTSYKEDELIYSLMP